MFLFCRCIRKFCASAIIVAAMGVCGPFSRAEESRDLPRPFVESARMAGGDLLELNVSAKPGAFYLLEASQDLDRWHTLSWKMAEVGAVTFTTAAGGNYEFFRVQAHHPNSAAPTNYHGWTDSVVLNNGFVQAIIVPEAGRIMQFQMAEEPGPFWENSQILGGTPNPNIWNQFPGSFGGDKSWPAPQSLWGWPPPRGFDAMSNRVEVANGVVTLISPFDGTFQARVIRRIELGFGEPLMRVVTTFERAADSTRSEALSVWVITQLTDPVRCYIPVPEDSLFPNGYVVQSSGPPGDLRVEQGLISFSRDSNQARKIGSDASTMLWVGNNVSLRIDSPRVPGDETATFPHNGSRVEIYTNPNPVYVELETLGPMVALLPGEQISRTNFYRLYPRTEPDPDAEARKILEN
jgi:hypothetical protein